MAVIPALRRWRQEDGEFEVSLGCKAKPCLRKGTNKHTFRCLNESVIYKGVWEI
jgi:hypothetical protein